MKTLRPITVNVEQLLTVNKYDVDEDNPHITLADDLQAIPEEEWGRLVRVCPAALYKQDDDGRRSFDYAGCLECGTCRIACEGGAVRSWNNPQPFKGVNYLYG